MNKFDRRWKPLACAMALLMSMAVAACGGGAHTTLLAVSSVASANPTVVSTNPADNASNVATSTNTNNVLSGTVVSASFNQAMDPTTLNSAVPGALPTYTVNDSLGLNVPGTVAMNAANTVASFTPGMPVLLPGTRYTATLSTAARSAAGAALATAVTWSFSTSQSPFTAQAPVALGKAGTFAILSKTGVTDVYASAINGDVGASPITGAAIGLKS
ncbi:MAG TPA: hypothetical protein DCW29_17220 [Janthinobacterium sp.]|nr:hypothetical protein [Janthinobacterium sp.]